MFEKRPIWVNYGLLRPRSGLAAVCPIFSALTDFSQKNRVYGNKSHYVRGVARFFEVLNGGGYIAPGLTIWRQKRHRATCRAVPDAHHEKARDHGARVGGVYMSFPGFDGIRNIRSATADCASHNGILRGTAITIAQWNGKAASDNAFTPGRKSPASPTTASAGCAQRKLPANNSTAA